MRRQTLGIAAGSAAMVVMAGVALAFSAGMAWAGMVSVSQKDRIFHPGELTIAVGDTVRIVNDDGELIHHAYVHTPQFSFDSGEQEPGSKTDIVFPVAGTFTVLCAIHPKMRLVVTVR